MNKFVASSVTTAGNMMRTGKMCMKTIANDPGAENSERQSVQVRHTRRENECAAPGYWKR